MTRPAPPPASIGACGPPQTAFSADFNQDGRWDDAEFDAILEKEIDGADNCLRADTIYAANPLLDPHGRLSQQPHPESKTTTDLQAAMAEDYHRPALRIVLSIRPNFGPGLPTPTRNPLRHPVSMSCRKVHVNSVHDPIVFTERLGLELIPGAVEP